jgi:putative PEP-CTERM system TPR-repeat lipoprotein
MVEAGKQQVAAKQFSAAVIQFKSALEKQPELKDARFLLGQSLLEEGDPAAAAVELAKALEKGYDREAALPLLAEALLASGDFKKLVSSYGATKLEGRDAQASLKASLSTAWLMLSDSSKSDEALAAALQASPDFAPAKLLQARQVAAGGDLTKALALLEPIVARAPKLYGAWMLKALMQAQLGDSKGAEDTLQKVLAIEPRYHQAHAAIISRRLLADDLPGAEAQLAKLAAIHPQHPVTLLAQAQIAYTKKELKRSRELVQQVLRMDPDNISALQLSGAVESQIGSLALAETQFTKILQSNPDSQVTRLNLGQTYLQLGQATRVLEILRPIMSGKLDSAQAHATAAEAYLRTGDAASAEVEFKRAATMNPADNRSAVAVAMARLSRGDAAAGMADLQSIASKSKDMYAELAIVSTLLRRGQTDAALAAIAEMDKKRPNEASVSELRGRVFLIQQKPQQAREAFEQAVKLNPALYSATAQLASLDIRESKIDAARQRFQASIKADPANVYPRMALAALQRRQGEPQEAVVKTLKEAISAAPNAATPRLMMIDLLLKQRLYKEALAEAGAATTALPYDVAVLEAAGRAASAAGNLEQASIAFRRLTNLLPNSASPWLMLADLHRSEGRKDAVETALKKAIEVEPQNKLASQRYLDLLVNSKRESEALEVGRSRQRQSPTDASGYLFEAVTQVRMKKVDEAVSVLQKGLKVAADRSDLLTVTYSTLVSAGRMAEAEKFAADWLKDHPTDAAFDFFVSSEQMRRGEYAKSEARLQRILAAHPDNALALNNMAWILIQTGKPGALPLAQRAVAVLPEDPNSLDTLALALAADKQYAKAIEIQRHAMGIAPENYSLRLTLAKVGIQAGDKAMARKELLALQELGAKFDSQVEVKKLLEGL